MAFAASISLATLDGTTGFRIIGEAAGDWSGYSVASAGDVNGDGIGDLIIAGWHAGASYVVFGSAAGFTANFELSGLNGTNGFKLSGYDSRSVASAGDINGDGLDDIIVGALWAGSSYVVYGKDTATDGAFAANLDLSALNGTDGFRIWGGASGGALGWSVASAGDVNGDGLGDLIIGDPYAYGAYSGASYVVFGSAAGFSANFDLSTLDGTNGFRVLGASSNLSGFSVASAGDVDGDGLDDLIVGAPAASGGSGASYVVFGKDTAIEGAFAAYLDLSTLDGTNGFQISGGEAYAASGISVASAGDVNGDGLGDLIIGAPFAGTGYVVFGRAAGFSANLNLGSLNGTNGFKISGLGQNGAWSVASAGDVNGDGVGDLIIGSNYVVFGRDTATEGAFAANLNVAAIDGSNGFRIVGAEGGYSAAAAGDVNGDGIDDLIVGAVTAHPNGASYVIYGRLDFTGTAGNDTRVGGASHDSLFGGGGNDVLSGMAGDDQLTGGDGADQLNGGQGADTLDGGLGADVMSGGSEDDIYIVDDLGDQVIENLNQGSDTVRASVDGWVLGANVERLELQGSADLSGTGNSGANTLLGNSGANALYGMAGADTLDGGLGADVMSGGTENDIYLVDDLGDQTIENLNQGSDTVRASVDGWVLAANIEKLELQGSGDLSGTGNSLANTLLGNSGDNTLSGLAGADTLDGGLGADVMSGGTENDTYLVDNLGDQTIELAGQGTDTVRATIDWVLGANFEVLYLLGSAGLSGTGSNLDNLLYGNSGANTLYGLGGVDILDGGLGADVMSGGTGNDTYIVENLGDQTIESANQGYDTVRTALDGWVLSANVEVLSMEGSAGLSGTGNSGANLLRGNSGVNTLYGLAGGDTLDGGLGADVMIGGADHDIYIADNLGDQTVENAGEGVDIVRTALEGWALGANIETLELQGSANLSGSGNSLNNTLKGNSGANTLYGQAGVDVLDGGLGADVMVGGTEDDIYLVDNLGDQTIENIGEGSDRVDTALDGWVLGANIEVLLLTGSAGLSGSGNSLANTLYGNTGANTLYGLAGADAIFGYNGDDIIVGGLGDDVMAGGAGADTFAVDHAFAAGLETDTISDFSAAQGDILDLSGAYGGTLAIVSAFTNTAGQMTLAYASGQTTVRLDIDGNGVAEYQLKINGDVTGQTGNWLL